MRDPVHGPRHQRLAPIVVRAAKLDPATRCWFCDLTLTNHPPHKNGRPAFWTAGHRVAGQPDYTLTLDDLVAEASVCNFKHDNNKLEQRDTTW